MITTFWPSFYDAVPEVLERVMREAAAPADEGREFGWDVDWDNGVDHSHSD